jgi:hypothetical protein
MYEALFADYWKTPAYEPLGEEEVLAQVEEVGWGQRKLVVQWHVLQSTYYRWRSQQRQGKLGTSSQDGWIP